MQSDEIETLLRDTLDDYRLTRSERRALAGRLNDVVIDEQDRSLFHSIAFRLARESMDTVNRNQVLKWLEDVSKVLRNTGDSGTLVESESLFSPNDDCWERIARLLRSAHQRVDICVFTISDDRVTNRILDAHQRGVRIQIITDNDKAFDPGSDAERLARAGVAVHVDRTSAHMHHKFAIFDHRRLLTGSYNWTRSAAEHNEENMLITDDRAAVTAFQREFDRLWDLFSNW